MACLFVLDDHIPKIHLPTRFVLCCQVGHDHMAAKQRPVESSSNARRASQRASHIFFPWLNTKESVVSTRIQTYITAMAQCEVNVPVCVCVCVCYTRDHEISPVLIRPFPSTTTSSGPLNYTEFKQERKNNYQLLGKVPKSSHYSTVKSYWTKQKIQKGREKKLTPNYHHLQYLYRKRFLIRYINIIIIMIIIHYYCHHFCLFLLGGKTERGRGISHWDEALVAIVETQCCWKLGDMAELQPSLWRGPFSPPSPSTIQGLPPASFPSMLQQPGAGGAALGTMVLTRPLGGSLAGG